MGESLTPPQILIFDHNANYTVERGDYALNRTGESFISGTILASSQRIIAEWTAFLPSRPELLRDAIFGRIKASDCTVEVKPTNKMIFAPGAVDEFKLLVIERLAFILMNI